MNCINVIIGRGISLEGIAEVSRVSRVGAPSKIIPSLMYVAATRHAFRRTMANAEVDLMSKVTKRAMI